MASGSISKGIENYLEKIHCLLACLNCEEWIVNANVHSIETLYVAAVEIEECLSQPEAGKIRESLKVVFPEYNFTRCGDIILETLMNHPQASEKMLISAIDKYLEIYSPEKLNSLLLRLVESKKIKEMTMDVIRNFNDGLFMMNLQAVWCLNRCRAMILVGNENFENYVESLLKEEIELLLESLSVAEDEIGRLISEVTASLLNDNQDLRLWFHLLSQNHIMSTSAALVKYPIMLEALLKFFDNYAAQVNFIEGKSFSWSHALVPINDFVEILHYFLENDGLVGIKVNEYLTQKINEMKEGYAFWVDIKALL